MVKKAEKRPVNILVTGASGFIGKNLIARLEQTPNAKIYTYDHRCDYGKLNLLSSSCDFVFNFAAVHRPNDNQEFEKVNVVYFNKLLEQIRINNNKCSVLLTSSYQARDNTAYGTSKLAAEEALKAHAEKINSRAIIYRLTNTFGRYARPNQHSVVATFCYNIARDFPISIHDPKKTICLYYIDDVIDSFIDQMQGIGKADADGFYRLPEELTYSVTLQELADKLYRFKDDLQKSSKKEPEDEFSIKLLATYLSYIPTV
jgi:UDP-2-acetamido-2,6-beta-L-arabino-hexul-4-ose reductase